MFEDRGFQLFVEGNDLKKAKKVSKKLGPVIHAKATRTWKGKKIPPPLLRGCPCGDFPPPIWNFGQIFPSHMSFGIKIH